MEARWHHLGQRFPLKSWVAKTQTGQVSGIRMKRRAGEREKQAEHRRLLRQ